jgi:DMSO/TMAO reductase YedYZ molybdopterin-dependent catalytic subunit
VREVSVTDPHSKQSSVTVVWHCLRCFPLWSALGRSSSVARPFASTVQVEALDGYRVAFSLAELDAGTGSTDAVVALEMDGKPLGGELGAFRMVVPTDKRSARWVRQVARIKVVQPSAP